MATRAPLAATRRGRCPTRCRPALPKPRPAVGLGGGGGAWCKSSWGEEPGWGAPPQPLRNSAPKLPRTQPPSYPYSSAPSPHPSAPLCTAAHSFSLVSGRSSRESQALLGRGELAGGGGLHLLQVLVS